MAREIGTHRTDWTECKDGPWYPSLSHGGYVAYRIWKQADGLRWFQRHEWKCADGSLEMDDWIGSNGGFDGHMVPVPANQITIKPSEAA